MFRKFDLATHKKSLQKSLGGLLTVKADDFADSNVVHIVRGTASSHFEIGGGLFDPLAHKRANLRIKPRHK